MAKNIRKAGQLGNRFATSQTEKASPEQVENHAGGFTFKVGTLERVRRFLILGSTEGTYYVNGKTEVKENIAALNKALDELGVEVVKEIVRVSDQGIAAKNDNAIYALAVAASHAKDEIRSYALQNLSKVCRIATHLFTFLTYVKDMRGFGSALKKAIARWYNDMKPDRLAQQVCKYVSRSVEKELPWSHMDALRMGHPIARDTKHNLIYHYVTKGTEKLNFPAFEKDKDLAYIYWHEKCMNAKNTDEVIEAISKGSLTFESVPKELLSNKEVYDELVKNMPLTATIRNLGVMTKLGTLKPLSNNVKLVIERITDEDNLKKGRMHPLNVLIAQRTYASGGGFRSDSTWTPVSTVVDALEEAFYKSFKYIEPTFKNILLGIDLSGSMSSPLMGLNITCAEAATALAMTVAKTEKFYHVMGFQHGLVDLNVTAKDSLESALSKASNKTTGGTDCSLPMVYAEKEKLDVEAFVVITDNETWYGSIHPNQALTKYKKTMNKPNAKLIVLAMTPTEFSIADKNDPKNQLDIAGFSSDTPAVISNFIAGKF